MKFAVTLAVAIAMIAPVTALQPIALTASPSEDGILLEWIDSAPATQYIIDRAGPDGTMQFILPGSESRFTDSSVGLGAYTYQVTAQRGMEEDQSNAAVMAWPGCLPAPVLLPSPGYVWPYSCYCPFPSELYLIEPYVCTTEN